MKKTIFGIKYMLALGILSTSLDFLAQTKATQSGSSKLVNLPPLKMEALKGYFLCNCLDENYREDSLFFKDGSMSYYADQLDFDENYLSAVKKYASQFASTIPISPLTNTKNTMYFCIKHYNSKKLELFLKNIQPKFK